MSSCDAFFDRFQSEMDDASAIGPEERWLSLAAGGALAALGFSRIRLGSLAALGAGAYLFYRGYTGRCPMRGRLTERQLGFSETPWESYGSESIPAEGPWEGATGGQSGAGATKGPGVETNVDCVDEAAMESFPASDPPSYTGTTAAPSVRIE